MEQIEKQPILWMTGGGRVGINNGGSKDRRKVETDFGDLREISLRSLRLPKFNSLIFYFPV